jgi:hypothetical protein
LLCLPGVELLSPAPGWDDWGLISSGGPPWKATFLPSPDLGVAGVGLKRSGLARGRVERRGGASDLLKQRRYYEGNTTHLHRHHSSEYLRNRR